MKYAKLRAIARIIYHALPLSQKNKWRLRERLNPLLLSLQRSPNKAGLVRAIATIASTGSRNSLLTRNHGRERALASILGDLAAHTYKFGPASHWIALPFLSMGGAERVALNLCKALLEINPGHSVVMLITDRRLINEQMLLPEKVAVIVFDNYLGEGLDYPSKQALLRDLLMAVRPYCLHNINSEVAWHLILAEGERLKKVVKLFASIFAFQFAPDGKTKTGYAAYFLKKSVPHLSGLISDNWRFVNDAIKEYHIAEPLLSNMRVVYQPCRLVDPQNEFPFHMPPFQIRVGRMQVLWAGRLDIEKRIDLFFEIVRHCDFADFHVFGQVVVDKDSTLPLMPNLSYHGPFATPLQWIEKHRFDAFLFTSKWEGMPNILIEAGALGIPTIAPTVGGVAELISEQTGYPLSENPSKNDYAVALNDISTHPEKAKKRAENLRELIKHRHSWLSFVATVASLPGYTEAPDPDLVEVTLANKTQEEIKSDIPLVSIIIPCFNQGRYLHECVASALASCHANIEIIVIDDGSTDSRTANYLADVTQMAPDIVRTHIQRNRGLSGARNSGLALARGEFIQFLDADDVLVPGKIDAQLAQLITNPRIDVSICNFLLCDETRSVFSKPDEAIAQFDLTLEDFLYRWERGFSVPIHCGLFRRRAIKDLYFDIHARAKEDWIFWTSLSLREARFGYINGHWAIYRQHNSSMRRSYLDMGRAWLQAGLRIEAMLGVREPLFFESVVAWFDLCYRSNPQYREEVAALQQRALTDEKDMTAKDESGLATSVIESDINVEKLVARLGLTCQTTKSPLISVIVPIYGHYEYLEACFESIAEQGDLPLEIILVDDASPDPRVTQLLGALKDRFDRLKVIIQPQNCGISSVQNSAVSIATGKYRSGSHDYKAPLIAKGEFQKMERSIHPGFTGKPLKAYTR